MMIPEITESGRPVMTDDLVAVEERFACTLPEPYARFMLRTNGGMPDPYCFSGKQPGDGGTVHFFYSIDGGEHTDIIDHASMLRGYVPKTLLPIARTMSGDIVCIGIAPNNHGQVWFWSHDHPVREEATWVIADDFDSFLSTFHEAELEPPRDRGDSASIPIAGPTPPTAPHPANAPSSSLETRREELARAYALLDRHEARQKHEDRLVDALLAACEDAAQALASGDAQSEIARSLKRSRERHDWLRQRREAPPARTVIDDEAGFRAQDDALMRAMTEHHISEAGTAGRFVELFNVAAKARKSLAALSPVGAKHLRALDAAFNEARDWLEAEGVEPP
jgi:hypothetical protein